MSSCAAESHQRPAETHRPEFGADANASANAAAAEADAFAHAQSASIPPQPPATAGAAATTVPLERVPAAVVAHLANEFLGDAEAIRLARSCRTLMRMLQRSYRLKLVISLDRALNWYRLNGSAAASADEPATAASPAAAAAAAPASASVSGLSPRIGLPTHVDVGDEGPAVGQAELDRLPPSVRILEWRPISDDAVTAARPLLRPLRLPPQLRELRSWAGEWCDEPNGQVPLPLPLPPALTALEFDPSFDRPVGGLRLPDGLRSLTFGVWFDQPLAALCLPHSLTALDLGGFRGTVADLPALPPTLQSLSFSREFDAPLGGLTLPPSLTAVDFGTTFNQPLEGVQWPQGLRSLSLGHCWNQSVERLQLPDSLTELNLYGHELPLDWARPPQGVTRLTIGLRWNHSSAQLHLPPALIEFTLPMKFNQPLDDLELPAALRSLTLCESLTHPLAALRLPAGLTELDAVQCWGPVEGVRWPASLTRMTAGSRYAGAGALPESLLTLTLNADWRQTKPVPLAEMDLPPRLQRLTLVRAESQSLADLRLPASLTALTLRHCHHLLPGWELALPPGLRELRLLGHWDHPVAGLPLPPRLEVLALGNSFNQPVDQLILPPTLTALHLGAHGGAAFVKRVSGLRLPAGLRVLAVPTLGRVAHPPLLVPPVAIPPSLCELRVHSNAVRFDRLSAWNLPARCIVRTANPPSWADAFGL